MVLTPVHARAVSLMQDAASAFLRLIWMRLDRYSVVITVDAEKEDKEMALVEDNCRSRLACPAKGYRCC
ncbi:hypothetical protein PT974_06072 [Cladobotryum mycophilum]|uniref:Uncharacterized protein n=1 Tax=Cladobotryum mycophilum TaxID=491253 RepID=A0ABR0SL78_9HYPO